MTTVSPASFHLGPDKLGEDVAVPRGKTVQAVEGFQAIGRENDIHVVCYGHLGDGNTHVNIVYDSSDEDQRARAKKCKEAVFRLTLDLGGTISGEHGTGITKGPYVSWQLGEEERRIVQVPGQQHVAHRQQQRGVGAGADGQPLDLAASVDVVAHRADVDEAHAALVNTTGQAPLSLLTNRAVRERIMAASQARGSRGGEFDNTAEVLELAKLRACAQTDRIIKGAEIGSPWDALLANGLRLAGFEVLPDEILLLQPGAQGVS